MPKGIPIWHFPPSSGGVSYGLTDAARTYFQAGRLRHVTREAIQNSLDSHDTGFPTVEVQLIDCTIPKASFAGDALSSHITACLLEAERTGATNSERDTEVLQMGIDGLCSPAVRCLAIIDSGTRGLLPENWHALVESEGIVQKSGGVSGGSFGIGKNAVFTVSDIFSVFYSTRYLDKRRGRVELCQGKARLMSHVHPRLNGSKAKPKARDYLQNTGFYRSRDMTPLMGRGEIPDEFRLPDGASTGIFILGFNPHSEDWVMDVQRAVCENFFMAISKGDLNVTIQPTSEKTVVVSHETIDGILSGLESSRDFYHYYQVTRQRQSTHVTNMGPPLGKLDVFLETGDGPSRTAYLNRKGMLITASTDQKVNPFALRRRATWAEYTVVVSPQTDEGDHWIRQMESPAHDAIQADQLPEPGEQHRASAVFADTRRQLREIIDSEMEDREAEISTNLVELARYLPENADIDAKEHRLVATRIQTSPSDTPRYEEYEYEETDGGGSVEREGTSSRGATNNGNAGPGKGDKEGRRARPTPRITLTRPRAIPVSPNQVWVSFTPPVQKEDTITVALHPRGYEPTAEAAIPVTKVESLSSTARASTKPNEGSLTVTFDGNERISLLITTDTRIDQISAFDLYAVAAR